MHNKLDTNWDRTFRDDVQHMNELYDYVNFDPKKRVTCFSQDPLDLYNFDSACPEVSKYLNRLALGILAWEPNLNNFGTLVLRDMNDNFGPTISVKNVEIKKFNERRMNKRTNERRRRRRRRTK